MPRLSRGSELSQRSPNLGDSRGSSQLRKSNSELDPCHRNTVSDKSSKLRGGRSPRGSQSDPVNQKRFGTRIAGLESQLQKAQEELKNLKDQLTSAQAAKEQAQQELEKNAAESIIPEADELVEEHSPPSEIEESNETDGNANENDNSCQQETDVFEVPVEKSGEEPKPGIGQQTEDNELNVELNLSTISAAITEPEKQIVNELALKNDEISLLIAKMGDKEIELDSVSQENEKLKTQLHEANLEISSARVKEEELILRLRQLEGELKTTQGEIVHSNELLETVEGAKEALEIEMTKLKVQTEQWRKAADAAAIVLAGDAEMNARGVSTRFESMDKHYCSAFEPPLGGFAGFGDSQGLDDDSDDGYGSGKKKSSGIRKFGDLWRKKSQK
ncbi:Interactor of constitutive active ROPs 4 [Heracleum sosnowskyi]|uniref:Interactor of constitutive active ROPs 4 n=1 Tax=Heracleum sosnowskyi TaxID=360622 RepID=A0AAD8M7A3_9APIA|nr:Interactor of constitutive active ROPs 4 [Heracleum sosnowskyi]